VETSEIKEMVAYYKNILQKEKIELMDRKREGITDIEFQKEISRLKEIKNVQEIFELKLILLEDPAEEDYNMYCPYQEYCKEAKKKCNAWECKEYQWGK
jgi:hypothetical protein